MAPWRSSILIRIIYKVDRNELLVRQCQHHRLGQSVEQTSKTRQASYPPRAAFLRQKKWTPRPGNFSQSLKKQTSLDLGLPLAPITFKILPPQYVDEKKYRYIEYHRSSVATSNAKDRHETQSSEFRNRSVASLCFDTSAPLRPSRYHDQNTAELNTTTVHTAVVPVCRRSVAEAMTIIFPLFQKRSPPTPVASSTEFHQN